MIVNIIITDTDDGKVSVDVQSSEPFSQEHYTKACQVAGVMLRAVNQKEEEHA